MKSQEVKKYESAISNFKLYEKMYKNSYNRNPTFEDYWKLVIKNNEADKYVWNKDSLEFNGRMWEKAGLGDSNWKSIWEDNYEDLETQTKNLIEIFTGETPTNTQTPVTEKTTTQFTKSKDIPKAEQKQESVNENNQIGHIGLVLKIIKQLIIAIISLFLSKIYLVLIDNVFIDLVDDYEFYNWGEIYPHKDITGITWAFIASIIIYIIFFLIIVISKKKASAKTIAFSSYFVGISQTVLVFIRHEGVLMLILYCITMIISLMWLTMSAYSGHLFLTNKEIKKKISKGVITLTKVILISFVIFCASKYSFKGFYLLVSYLSELHIIWGILLFFPLLGFFSWISMIPLLILDILKTPNIAKFLGVIIVIFNLINHLYIHYKSYFKMADLLSNNNIQASIILLVLVGSIIGLAGYFLILISNSEN